MILLTAPPACCACRFSVHQKQRTVIIIIICKLYQPTVTEALKTKAILTVTVFLSFNLWRSIWEKTQGQLCWRVQLQAVKIQKQAISQSNERKFDKKNIYPPYYGCVLSPGRAAQIFRALHGTWKLLVLVLFLLVPMSHFKIALIMIYTMWLTGH